MTTIAGLFVRHALTALGGSLALKGLIPSTEVEAFVGAVLLFGGIAWSAFQKWKTGQLAKK